MILTCPDCSTRYSVKDGAIGPNGRTVRCSNCSATWFVSQSADELALADMQTSDVSMVQPEPPRPDPEPTPSREMTDPVVPEPGAHVRFRDKADRQKRNRRLMGVSMIWIVALGLLGSAAVLGYAFRQDIVAHNSAIASLYKALNIDVTANGLDFEDPATRHVILDGQPVLLINGYIVNRSNKAQPLPMIELSFLNGSEETIAKWLVEPSQAELGARQRLEYATQYPNPPVDAKELSYRFVDDADLHVSETAAIPDIH